MVTFGGPRNGCLYAPNNVVRSSAILAACLIFQQLECPIISPLELYQLRNDMYVYVKTILDIILKIYIIFCKQVKFIQTLGLFSISFNFLMKTTVDVSGVAAK